jgi:hypothetical protein
MEDRFSKFLQRFLQSLAIRFWNKYRDHLVAALTDLALCSIPSDLDAKMLERATSSFLSSGLFYVARVFIVGSFSS